MALAHLFSSNARTACGGWSGSAVGGFRGRGRAWGRASAVQLWPHEILTADLGLNQGFEIDKLFREWDTEVQVLLTLSLI